MTRSRPFPFLQKSSVLVVPFLAILLLSRPSHAQWGAAATFSAAHLELESGSDKVWVYGPTLSVQYQTGRIIKFGVDARAAFLRSGVFGVNAGDAGPRIVVRIPWLHIEPYGEFLLGFMGARSTSSNKFTGHLDAQLLGGLDVPLRRHIDLRLEYANAGIISFGGSKFLSGDGEDGRQQISAGLLAHF